ncbi:MAG: penicillin-binding protein 2 [Patescibacteria group bacterium]
MQRYIGRIRVLTALCVVASLVIIGRLYYLQIMRGESYARRADAQFVVTKNPLLDRGTIFFTDKDGTRVTAATLSAVASSSDHQRYYPGGSLAAQEIGFVAYNNDDVQKGRYGLEQYYDAVLSREDSYSNFFVQLFGSAKTALEGGQGTGDLVTTIEPSVQAELERTLADYGAAWHPRLSGGIVMDPQSGEVVAMAVSPTFDLNSFNTQSDPLIYANPMVQNVYEMGSIMKPLTMAAGLDSGAITENTTYNDKGCITVDTKQICNFDSRARGVVSMQQVLSQSLNLGASFVATAMGRATMRDYFLNRYKLGQETGVDLPGEVHGLVSNLSAAEQVSYDTASFGQGIATTPIETVRALATLANGGFLVTPHFGKAITYDTGVTRALGWGEKVAVLRPQTATTISRMLTAVVDTSLAGGKDKLERYSVAAKTGTAQIANPQGGGYYEDRYLHSFFGYFPSYDARFVVFLFAVEPQGAPFASQTWAPPFHALTQFLINYYQLPPDR